ncbi:MAG: hypothetical protein Kow0091_27790 [Geminocystis sp.]|uniref:Competence protein ComFB n=1 Tax=Cyanobacterium aponinum 0216 TaxID=2676140 RepID=A0A844GU73_9CHRO|nr:late competence development ComFB family protein [Cyanobacterium aponinum]MTF40037.1 competence protein ComFB [Cyanobacterium aponinum 0216]
MVSEPQTYKNVMEAFVQEEIEFQLQNNKALSRSADYINLLEVATFALNRLPCYYASSIEGIERQRRRIKEKRELKQKISFVVSQAFAAVERDPLRRSTPIIEEDKKDIFDEARSAVYQAKDTLPETELCWIISFMEAFLTNVTYNSVSAEEVVKLYYLLYYYWQENQ